MWFPLHQVSTGLLRSFATVSERDERYTHIISCLGYSDRKFAHHCGLHGMLQLTLATEDETTLQSIVDALVKVVGSDHQEEQKILLYCNQGASASAFKAATASQ
jgi:hypothetical protein